jgi:hypothetical protein
VGGLKREKRLPGGTHLHLQSLTALAGKITVATGSNQEGRVQRQRGGKNFHESTVGSLKLALGFSVGLSNLRLFVKAHWFRTAGQINCFQGYWRCGPGRKCKGQGIEFLVCG